MLVDIEEDSWNLSPAKIKEAITERTKAILVVHSFGHAARMDEISDIARRKAYFLLRMLLKLLEEPFKVRCWEVLVTYPALVSLPTNCLPVEKAEWR